jgi:Raf kinase inhibitor-like YbhB/YbcL family protein
MKKILLFMLLAAGPCFAADFSVQSASWQDGQAMKDIYVFNSFGCTGNNVSPQISWSGAPQGTKSFAVTVYDPDAPTGSGWWHWTVFNIPANITQISEEAGSDPSQLPAGAVQGRTDFGKPGYGGACPPKGDKPHRYILTVYALKTDKIDLNGEASGALVGYYVNQNTLAKASLTVTYGR